MVPNVFTPNEDRVNDEFIVLSNGVSRFSIEIYSRWGNLLFKRSGQEQIVWDGTLPDGTKINPGTYYYVITAHDDAANYEPAQGFITVFY
jgi:gliding motility-associated-like protein